MKSVAALIVAGGRGKRLGHAIPKQYVDPGGGTILHQTVRLFLEHPQISIVLVVIHPDDEDLYRQSVAGLSTRGLAAAVSGGATRAESVRNGLDALAAMTPDCVLIHDAARPFCPRQVISEVIATLDAAEGAFPALPVVDALWRLSAEGKLRAQDRGDLWRAQTPQGFRYAAIRKAHAEVTGPYDDDVGVALAAGLDVRIVPGSEKNFKVTIQADLERARDIAGVDMDVRTGNGFDVHRFADGDSLVLNGVRIPFGRSLKGHSDADVGMHAVTDAIFGALAEGDIGQWFPPSDPQWKGAASEVFLRKAVERVDAGGFSITNVDCTLICEQPKIGPHTEAMRAELARICGIEVARVSVKATTTERLGFAGREEGIAAMATATLVRG